MEHSHPVLLVDFMKNSRSMEICVVSQVDAKHRSELYECQMDLRFSVWDGARALYVISSSEHNAEFNIQAIWSNAHLSCELFV